MLRIIILLMIACFVGRMDILAADNFDPAHGVTSPDGRFTVLASADLRNYKIVDHQIEQTDESVIMYAVPSSVRWTGNSKTIVAIEHRAGGSSLILITLKKNTWNWFEAAAPDHTGHAAVIGVKIGRDKVGVKYKGAKEKPNGLKIGYYTCSFAVSTDTDEITHIIQQDISSKAFSHLKNLDD